MVLAQNLAAFFNQTVTIEPYTGKDDFGKPTYGTGVDYAAKIEFSTMNIRTDYDREIKSTRQIFLNTTTTSFDTRDRITLPTAFQPTQPLILFVRVVLDRQGVSHIVLQTE